MNTSLQDYLPKTMDDFYGNETVVEFLNILIQNKKVFFPNIIFSGDIGTGKTFLKNIVLEKISPAKILRLNLSHNLKTKSGFHHFIHQLKIPCRKIISLDNCLKLKEDYQKKLATIMRNYDKKNIFVFCVNDISNLLPSFEALFVPIKLNSVTTDDKMHFIKHIIKNKQLQFQNQNSIISHISETSSNFKKLIHNLLLLCVLCENNDKKEIEMFFNISEKKYMHEIFSFCQDKQLKSAIGIIRKLMTMGYSEHYIMSLMEQHVKTFSFDNKTKKFAVIKILVGTQIELYHENKNFLHLIVLISKFCNVD